MGLDECSSVHMGTNSDIESYIMPDDSAIITTLSKLKTSFKFRISLERDGDSEKCFTSTIN